MLKATFTKIKTACVIALVPRVIRGDGRYTTKKFGKSPINVLRKAGKSTDSGSKDGEKDCDKCNRIIEFVFGQNKSKPEDATIFKDTKVAATNMQEQNKNEIIRGPTNIVKTRNKKRNNRLLKDFVGVDKDVNRKDHNLNRNVLFKAAASDKPKVVRSKGKLNHLGEKTNIATSLAGNPKENISKAQCKWSSANSEESQKRSRAEGYENKRPNPHGADVPDHIPATNYKLQATTAKQKEEKLTQKIEDIDEIPHVEASTSKVEGMNVSPKILGDHLVQISGTYKKSKSDFQGSLDEIAKKCMNAPPNLIDKKLMQEMKQRDSPNINEKSLMDEDFVQMDRLEKPEKPLHEVEIDFETRDDKREPVNCSDNEKLTPSFEMPPHLNKGSANSEIEVESTNNRDLDVRESTWKFGEKKKESASTISIQESLQGDIDSKPQFDINKPLIDPYGKKTLAFHSDEFEEAIVDSKILDDQRIGKPSQNDINREQTFTETYVTSSGVTELELSERTKDVDHVQSMYDAAPREINWRPYPSFEAREEVIDFCKQREDSRDNLKLIHTEPTSHMRSELQPELEQSYEPQSDRIYTSTSVSSEPREQISHGFVQPQSMINPLMEESIDLSQETEENEEKEQNNEKNIPDTLESLPCLKPDGEVPLTELLRRVRMRNRLEYCREFALHTLNVHSPETLPTEGKCGKKTPPCPPPPPKCPPPCPCPPRPPACPPPPPPCPKPCKPVCPQPCPPPKKNPCNKFKKKCEGASIREVLTLLAQYNTQIKIPQKYFLPLLAYKTVNNSEPAAPEENLLNDNLVFRLSVLGKILLFHCTEAIEANLPRNQSELSFARDFEPWTPIPSWPIPIKEEKKRFVCPKEGCKGLPPPKLNSPCKENPCLNFPKRSNFSLTDIFSFSLVESLLYQKA